jgi:release factor glutamine methyltransferase
MTIRDARKSAIKILKNQTPQLDVDVLLQYITGRNRSWILAHDDELMENIDTKNVFWSMIKTRSTGLPIAYITNHKEFYGYDFYVTPDVLIPKPDTELMVDLVISFIKNLQVSNLKIADICTGSGCIAISVVKSLLETATYSKLDCYCTDISENALKIARKNADRLLSQCNEDKQAFCQLHFLQGDLCEALPPLIMTESQNKIKVFADNFDVIVSNPPYVPALMTDELLKDGRNEPRLALDGDAKATTSDGTSIMRELIPQVYNRLKSGGVFFIETGEYNAKTVVTLMKNNGYINVRNFCDISGLPRVTCGFKR